MLFATLSLLFATSPPAELRIDVKSPIATFSAQHDLVLRDGKIWWRRRNVIEPFALLPPQGLPAGKPSLQRIKEILTTPMQLLGESFDAPAALVSISADGDNLIAVDARRRVYYTKLSTLEWTDTWGPAGARGPLIVPPGAQLAMSHRKQAYEDIDGNPHPVSAGVTTLYALSDDGMSLTYADPWLPPKFAHTICLPDRGRFIARSMSASASVVAVMDARGRVFTRLVDFDILGNNPALPYSYKREKRTGAKQYVRSLPAEEWREHARIDGKHSARMSIHVVGEGNEARELRVEGEGGYFHKRVDDRRWKFHKTGVSGSPQWIDPRAVEEAPPRARTLTGAPWRGAEVILEEFDPVCPPAKLIVSRGKDRVELTLHFHETIEVFEEERDLKGALILARRRGKLADELLALFDDGLLEVEVDVSKDRVTIDPVGELLRAEPRFIFARR